MRRSGLGIASRTDVNQVANRPKDLTLPRRPWKVSAVAVYSVKTWLKKKQGRAVLYGWAYLLLAGFVGCVIAFLTAGLFFLFFKLIVLIVIPMWPHPNIVAALLTSPIVVLAFIDSRNASRDDMSILPLWLAREYFDIGPRLVWTGIREFLWAERFAQIDTDTCANVLGYVAADSTPVSRAELTRAFPGLNWAKLISELELIDGVILFRYEMRISLLMPLRLELRQFVGKRMRVEMPPGAEPPPRPEPEPEIEPVREPERLSAFQILGISEKATIAEIKLAYRSRMKEWHPDRFPNLDEESRRMAEDWTKALNAAYEELLRQRNGGRNR